MASSYTGIDLCAYPAGTPPSGQSSNLVDPPSLAATTIAVTTVTLVWAVTVTAARVHTKLSKLGLADCFVVIALALSATYLGLVLAMLKYAKHQWDIPACWFNGTYMKILYAQGVLLGPTIFFAKCSIFLLYRQIFTIQKPMKIAIWVGLIFTFLLYWAGVPLESYFSAPHVGETWEDLLTNGRPEHLIYWGIVQGTCSVVLDIYIFLLPLPMLAQLQMAHRRRLQLLAVFSTAMMGIVASVCALVFRVRLKTTADTSYVQSALFICVIVENNVAIIVSSMPFFPAFLRAKVLDAVIFRSLRSKLSALRHSSDRSAYAKGSDLKRSSTSTPSKGQKWSSRNLLDGVTDNQNHELEDVSKSTVAVQIRAGSHSTSNHERGISREVNIQQETQSIV
ncbi:hypothetical protein BO79DRAFT_261503 [Aspergillus costaricaensis CBS 115574]|uniref:Uncharacterized protein n=1 Tax=Aspergillus costaricaensis CBS 115574 TaxID=1448317 RepID=A0ACD1IVB4_9EURO|nr:hypothetical protein BO79DRAFT_261503 [Aspergillus costaricaensis CBS 115574]RAK94387.1 hypothetical protein BO79DRAFT_261503 [Aspergillus costaricaensis CBS 115574]